MAPLLAPHLAQGSICPARAKGTLRIYGMARCPFVHRVLMIANACKIRYELVNVNLSHKPDWFLEKSPTGAVPLLESDEGLLKESVIICEYLQAISMGRKLVDPIKKAKDSLLLQKFDQKIGSLLPKLLFNTKMTKNEIEEGCAQMTEFLKIFDVELEALGTKFFGGKAEPGLIDNLIWPFVQRLSIIRLVHPALNYDFHQAKALVPNWEKWRSEMKHFTRNSDLYNKKKQIDYIVARREGKEIKYD